MADYSKRIMKKEFKDENSKNCYLKVCKFLANNIVNDDGINSNCNYNISKKQEKDSGLYVYTLEVYSKISETETKERHCNICKETHSSFFISEETNCNWCKINAFDRRIDEQLSKISKMIKERMRGKNGN